MLRIAVLYPELLGTYGDGGNALVLKARAARRGEAVEVVAVALDDSLPDAQLFLLGGGEDGPQRQATHVLRADNQLARRVDDGAVVFGVCAGLQLLGTSYEIEGGAQVEGLGLVEATTQRGARRRVGDIAVRVGDDHLVGFENHGGETQLGTGVSALGEVVLGHGNDGHVDGFRAERVLATYAHGPVLALNPWLADELLTLVLGRELEPLETLADELHRQRVTTLLR